jgi:hypothetical protein
MDIADSGNTVLSVRRLDKRANISTVYTETLEVNLMELLIPPRHRKQFAALKDNYSTERTKIGPITWHGYLRVETSDQELIDALKQQLDAQPQ